jgi:hypothetical protein
MAIRVTESTSGERVINMDRLDTAHLDTVLEMITNDIREIKDSIKAHQLDTREEFRRVRDKMDAINGQFLKESKDSAVLLKEVETRQQESAKFAGRIAGAISGFVTALFTSLIAGLAKWWMSGNS